MSVVEAVLGGAVGYAVGSSQRRDTYRPKRPRPYQEIVRARLSEGKFERKFGKLERGTDKKMSMLLITVVTALAISSLTISATEWVTTPLLFLERAVIGGTIPFVLTLVCIGREDTYALPDYLKYDDAGYAIITRYDSDGDRMVSEKVIQSLMDKLGEV